MVGTHRVVAPGLARLAPRGWPPGHALEEATTGEQGAAFITGLDVILWAGLRYHHIVSPRWSDLLTHGQHTHPGPPPAPRPHTGLGQAVVAGIIVS